jgi:ATP-dependent helicase/nuclease subunit A
LSPGDGELLVDARERELAESDLSCNYWVEAGAGTGKTTLLIRRLLHIILSGSAQLSEIAAITFTEKAAAELKARLRDELERLAGEAPEEQLPLIRRALEELEGALITTIHSFAGSLLRERPVEAAVDPHYSILDEGDLEDLLEEIWEDWFFSELAAAPEVLTRALTLGVTPQRLKELGRLLYRQRDLVREGSTPEPPALLQPFCDLLAERLPELKALLGSCHQQEDRGYRHLVELIAAAGRLLHLDDGLERERYFMRSFPAIASRGNQKNWQPKEACRRQKGICSELKQARESALRSIQGQLTAALVGWCRGYLEAVERAKAESGSLDFQDLLLRARDLVRDSKEVRGYFQKRFRYLLVDEFQDTDPLQVDLLFLLAEEKPGAASWKEAHPAAGKLFLVGDPKQSIYRFRRADIEIYQAARQKILQHGALLNISQNFRTLPGLIEWVNRAFERLIEPQGGYQPEYQHLSAYRRPWCEPPVILLHPAGSLDEARADEIRAAEADAVAELLKTAVGSWRIPAAGGGGRSLQYGDVALLFPTTTGIHHFEEALRRCGIPFRLEGGRQFYLREEIAFLKNLLASVDNPYDEVALTAALRYWTGIPDETLYCYRAGGGRLSYLSDPGAEFPKLQEAFELLREMHLKRQSLPLATFVEELLEKTWFWQRLPLRPSGHQAAGNLRKALQMIRVQAIERPLTLKGYINWLDRVSEQGREEAESLLHDHGSDAVQMLTIHRSKGLEFPVVCLANLGGRSRGSTPFMADRSKGRFYLKLGELVSEGVEEAEKQERLRLEAEQIRLLYVATTRARDCLILPRFYKEGSPGFWSYLEQAEAVGDDLWEGVTTIKAGAPHGISEDPLAGAASSGGDAALLDEMIRGRRRCLDELDKTIRSAAVAGPYISASSLVDGGEEEENAAAGAFAGNEAERLTRGGGALFGSAFHEIMERIDLHSSPEQVAALSARAANHWGLADSGELARLVGSTLEHPLIGRARRAEFLQRELPFIYEFEGLLVEGIVDLVFREGEELVVVDYKTDVGEEETLERRWSHYSRQGMIYALALAEISGMAVKEVSFLFVRKGFVKSLHYPCNASLRKTLRKNIN